MSRQKSSCKKRWASAERRRPGLCAVCGAPVLWPSWLDLGKGREKTYLCHTHQRTFGIDYPPEPPLT